MKSIIRKTFIYLCSFVMLCLCMATFLACDNTISTSDQIFIDDFSETYTISIKAKVRNHSTLPNASRSFEYSKGLDKLYESIIDAPPYSQFVRKENNMIFVDFRSDKRIYSCIIYPGASKNQYIVHSMTYALGEWANYQSIFFPAYSLNREISTQDDASTSYTCSFSIEELQRYYTERGYLAEIQDNKLCVVCLLTYPYTFAENADNRKAVSWSIVYEEEYLIRFADVSNDYPLYIVMD